MAQNGVMDPLQALSAALSVPTDSPQQAELLGQVRDILEANPGAIQLLCTSLLPTVGSQPDSLVKRWLLDLLQFAICGTVLSHDVRTQLALLALDTLVPLLYSTNVVTVKTVIQCFSSMYPLIFRAALGNRSLRAQWDAVTSAKARIVKLVESPTAPVGVKIVAIKFMQRAILVQTKGLSDPRLQNIVDPNLVLVSPDHPFISASALEAEGLGMLQQIITILFTSKVVDILSSVLNCLHILIKLRPNLGQVVVSTLVSWTPAALADQPASSVRSVEKAMRILMNHVMRSPYGAPFVPQLSDALNKQAARIEQAAREERARRQVLEASKKRAQLGPPDDETAAKRLKLDPSLTTASQTAVHVSQGNESGGFDVTSLPAPMVIDLIIANLLLVPDQTLIGAIQAFRQSHATFSAATAAAALPVPPPPTVAPSLPVQYLAPPSLSAPVKTETVELTGAIEDDEEMEYEPDRLNEQLSLGDLPLEIADDMADADMEDEVDALLSLRLANFKLPLPEPLSDDGRGKAIQSSISRIWQTGQELETGKSASASETDAAEPVSGLPSVEMWMLLLVRMVTRGDASSVKTELSVDGESEEEKAAALIPGRSSYVRQKLCDYVVGDFSNRLHFASVWLNEEWYNDKRQLQQDPSWPRHYHRWLRKILDAHRKVADPKDKSLTRFLLDLPDIPPDVLEMLREFITTQERTTLGFSTLRELVTLRPPLRKEALRILFDLTTHPEKLIRVAAINTVKRWVPDVKPLDGYVRSFAVQMLRRLCGTRKLEDGVEAKEELETDGKPNGELQAADDVFSFTSYLPEHLSLPVEKSIVQQHLELYFVLCTKVPELLDELFASYGQMDISVQEAIQDLITALVKSLGQSNGKLLTLLRTFPRGADSLALRALTILTEKQRPTAPLVALVKALVAERDLDARFLMPIIAEMDKADILRYLPRIVSILNTKPAEKALVRSVFSSIVTATPQTFAVSSNLPRLRQSELLSPVELMVILHNSEKEIGIKPTMEAISICFAMTDVYRSEVLGAVIQQIVDEPTLPTLFMRTVIMAVQKYKSLTNFVSTTILSRLIPKKVWEVPQLWDGFVRCAKMIAPASFGALLQLPRAQLREIVNKDPDLRAGLRDFVVKKAGNKARVASLLEVFGEDEEGSAPATPIAAEA